MVLAISLLVTGASTKALKVRVLDKVSSIFYLIQFCKDKSKHVLALLDSGSEVNAITSTYAAYLGLKVRVTNVGMQKINESSLAIYNIVIAAFKVVDKLNCSRLLQKTFLLANINMKVVLGILFFIFGNADVPFTEKELTWKSYTTKKVLSTTCQVKIIDQKEFAKVVLDENFEAFVVHVNSLGSRISIYLARKAQFALLLIKDVTMLTKYSDFADFFLEKSANVLSERTGVNERALS